MNIDKAGKIENIINTVIDKHFNNDLIWFGSIKENDDNTYIIDIKYSEDFISMLDTPEFHIFRREIYNEVHKIDGYRHGMCKASSCHGCRVDTCAYRIQFSEGAYIR